MRVTFRGAIRAKKPTQKPSKEPPTRQQCETCEWGGVSLKTNLRHCFHPRNGRPCNPARSEPWKWGLPCPVAAPPKA